MPTESLFDFSCPKNRLRCRYSRPAPSATTEDAERERSSSCGLCYLVLTVRRVPPVNSELSASAGIVEHRDRPLAPVRFFSQAEINHGKIAYRPPAAAPHLREMIAFSFAGKERNVLRSAGSDGCR